jgi:LmbE family N-acetylglucosaminyl deacetylase
MNPERYAFRADLKVDNNRLWLLAHQDDEVFGLHLHSNLVSNFIVYLTNGVRSHANFDSLTRAEEARESWRKIDGNAELIFFGTYHALNDSGLQSQINIAHLDELISICHERKINEIVTLQLEGGHQDHDITSILAEELSVRLSLKLVAFPAYRALHKTLPIYTVMTPSSKMIEKNSLSLVKRIQLAQQSCRLMKNYRTQIITWVGLGPFVILKYLLGKPTHIILTDTQRVNQELPKKFLYIIRKKNEKIDYVAFRKEISNWKIPT